MATHEHIGLQTYKDSNGEKHLLYPVVKAECIADPENIPGFATELELQNVENKIPTDTVTAAQLEAVENKIPTNTVTSDQLKAVENKIPTDTVTSLQLKMVENKIPAAQIQADWNQNDPTAKDYVKNRPFWESDPVLTTVIPETTAEITTDGYTNLSFVLEIGKTYTITCDGVEYEYTAIDFQGMGVALGNPGAYTADPSQDDGCPLGFGYVPGQISMVMSLTTATHTFSVTTIVSEIHKLDNKFIDAEWMAKITGHEEVEILAESQLTAVTDTILNSGLGSISIDLSSTRLDECESVAVTYDGTVYESQVIHGDNLCYFGNSSVADYGAFIGDPPFFYLSSLGILFTATLGEHTIEIMGSIPLYNKLPEEYLPDTIARTSDIPAAITVDSALSSTSTNPVQNKVINAKFTEVINKIPDAVIVDSTLSVEGNAADAKATGEALKTKAPISIEDSMITWDGDTTDLIYVPHPNTDQIGWYHVSDLTPDISTIGDYYTLAALPSGDTETRNIDGSLGEFANTSRAYTIAEIILVALDDNVSANGLFTLPKKGVYFEYATIPESGYDVMYVSELAIKKTVVDPEYIPDSVKLPSVTTENNGAFLRVVNGAWAAVTLPNAEEASF